jgi:PAS domain S-box-containing protein
MTINKLLQTNPSGRSPIAVIAVTTIAIIAISIYCLASSYFIIFQNLFYVPVIIACMYYTRRGFAFSIIIACLYFLLTLAFTRDPSILLQAFVRVLIFVLVAGVITFLSLARKRVEDSLRRQQDGFKGLVQERTAPLEADIAERKRAEESLRKNETQLRAILDATPFPIALVDVEDNVIEYWSRSALALFGHTAPTASEWYAIAYPDPDYRREVIERWKPALEKAQLSGLPVNTGEYRLTCRDGSVCICELYATFLENRLIITFNNITERKRAEEALRESEDKFKYIFDNSVVGKSITLLSGEMHANKAFCELLGYTPEELQSKRWQEITHPEDIELTQKEIDALLSGEKEAARFAKRYLHRNGSVVWVDVSTSLRRDEQGKPLYLMTTLVDITERKRAEEALQKSEKRLREAQEMAHLGFWTWDVKTGAVEWSEEVFKIFRLDSKEFTPQIDSILTLSPWPEDHQRDQELIKRAIETRSPGSYEQKFLRPDKSIGHYYSTFQGNYDEKGDLISIVGTVLDITERKKKEGELAVARQFYRELFDNVKIGLLRSTPGSEGTFIDVNPAMVRMFEADSREQLMSLHPSEIYWDTSQRKIVSDAIIAKGFANEEISFKTLKGRSIWCRITAVRKTDTNGQVYFDNTIEDISERKQVEEALNKTLADLERSNMDLEQFAYVASHDLQEPLRMVSSFTQLLGQRYKGKLDKDADEFIGYAVEGAVNMQRLINDLLSYSRLGTRGKPPSPIPADSALDRALENLKLVLEESQVEVKREPLPTVTVDDVQLIQVFQNLIANAIKFRGDESPRSNVSCEARGSEWVFSVRDNGIGIDPQYLERIFIIFQRLHKRGKYPGTGIGLAMCKKIIVRHGGRIWVESEPGKGSTFYFSLPKTGGQ